MCTLANASCAGTHKHTRARPFCGCSSRSRVCPHSRSHSRSLDHSHRTLTCYLSQTRVCTSPSLLSLLLFPFFTRSLSPTHTYALSHARKNKSTYQRFSNHKEGEASLKPHVTCAMRMPFLASHTRHTTMRRRKRTRASEKYTLYTVVC